ncbi:MAG TPA: GNAT family N-acetyltransferase [Planctomycetaceae bacterium]|nr:GNAT family N-acetyltransferase [Planctomycetaceae bacterium]
MNVEDWEAVRTADRNPFVERGFVRAVERSMRDPGWFRYAILYDESDAPVAVACFALFDVDGALLAPKFVQSFTRGMRKVFRRFMRLRMLLCGLPVSVSGSNLAVVPGADWDRISATLLELAEKLARESKAVLISFKEFTPDLAERLQGLERAGYYRGNSIVTYLLEEDCSSFEEYYNSRSKRTRANMRKYFRNLEDANISWESRSGGGAGFSDLYTDEVHQLYEQVFERAEIKFEHVPPEFFRELALQCPEASRFTIFSQEGNVVGFCAALTSKHTYDMLYCGFDYGISEQSSLYFNILYRGVEDGYNQGLREMYIGASSDEFKRRLGCRGVALSVFVKGVGIITGGIFKLVAPLMFPKLDSKPVQESSETER